MKEKGRRTGGRTVSGLLQCGKICPGILPWGSGKGKCGKFVHIPVYRYFHCDCRRGTVFLVWKEKGTGTGKEYTGRKGCVTIQQPLSHEVSWHEYAQIPRHTSKNAITEGDF